MSPRLEVIVGGDRSTKRKSRINSLLLFTWQRMGKEGGQGNLCMLIDFLFSSPLFLDFFFGLRKCLGNNFRNIYCKLIVCVLEVGGKFDWRIGVVQESETGMSFMCHSGIYLEVTKLSSNFSVIIVVIIIKIIIIIFIMILLL